jgi:hypothetical protein
MTAVEFLEQELDKNFEIRGNSFLFDKILKQAKEMEKEQMINFALFRDDYLEKAEKLEDFTIPNEKLIRLFKHETFKSE